MWFFLFLTLASAHIPNWAWLNDQDKSYYAYCRGYYVYEQRELRYVPDTYERFPKCREPDHTLWLGDQPQQPLEVTLMEWIGLEESPFPPGTHRVNPQLCPDADEKNRFSGITFNGADHEVFGGGVKLPDTEFNFIGYGNPWYLITSRATLEGPPLGDFSIWNECEKWGKVGTDDKGIHAAFSGFSYYFEFNQNTPPFDACGVAYDGKVFTRGKSKQVRDCRVAVMLKLEDGSASLFLFSQENPVVYVSPSMTGVIVWY